MTLHQIYKKQVEAKQNPLVRLEGACYNQLITSAVLEHGMIVWRTLTRAFLQLYRFESPMLGNLHFTLSGFFLRLKRGTNHLMRSVRVLCNRESTSVASVLLNDELHGRLLYLILPFVSLNSLVVFYRHLVFKVLPHSVLLHYSNLTKISQNCVVKSQEMVAILSHKIGTTLSNCVYATLNRATPLTRSGVMSG